MFKKIIKNIIKFIWKVIKFIFILPALCYNSPDKYDPEKMMKDIEEGLK